jgi:hypothetical protein
VRVGNGAFRQRQIDVYGQVLDLALLYERLGGRLSEQYRRLLRTLAAVLPPTGASRIRACGRCAGRRATTCTAS